MIRQKHEFELKKKEKPIFLHINTVHILIASSHHLILDVHVLQKHPKYSLLQH